MVAACSPTTQSNSESEVVITEDSIVIEHVMGRAILDKPAIRVVALEWTYVEDLLVLGIQPVGIADIAGYNEWVKTPVALSDDVVDLGLRSEPNFETLASLDPDLIIEGKYSAESYYDKLTAIAPTIVSDPYSPEEGFNQYEEMRSTLLKIAQATGKEAEGEAVLAHLDQKIEDARAQIEAAGLTGEKFVLSQMFSWESAVYVRLFTDNGMATQIVEQIGLDNGWDGGYEAYGFSQVSVEALSDIGDVHYFYVVSDDDEVMNLDTVSPLWASLPFVQNGHAYPLGGDTWLFGGPLSAELIIDVVTSQLVK